MKREISRGRTRSVSRARRLEREAEDNDAEERVFEDAAGPAEAAAVAWSMFALGGLGVASTAVFGAGELD